MADNVKEFRSPGEGGISEPYYANEDGGANGWEWRMIHMLRDFAGNHALASLKAEDPYAQQWEQWHERMCDRVASRIQAEIEGLESRAARTDSRESEFCDQASYCGFCLQFGFTAAWATCSHNPEASEEAEHG